MKLYITGMYCVNCRTRIERKLKGTRGVKHAIVDQEAETLDIEFDPDILSTRDIKTIINDLGYGLNENRSDRRRKTTASLAAIAALFVIMNHFGVLNVLVPRQLADNSMGYGALFLTGLLTSVHCLAMCGGINLSQSLPSPKEPIPIKLTAYMQPFLYNLGRIISYTLTGTALGCIGLLGGAGTAGVSTVFQGSLKTAAGIYMVLLGGEMLHVLHMPRLSFHLIFDLASSLQTKKHRGPFIVGLLNGLMPCGPLQTVQLIALASGSPVTGALTMLSFGMGTMPLMLGFGVLVSLLGIRFRNSALTSGAVLLTVMGLSMLVQGYALAGTTALNIIAVLACLVFVIYAAEKISLRRFVRLGVITAVFLATTLGICHWMMPGLLAIGNGSQEEINSKVDEPSRGASVQDSSNASGDKSATTNGEHFLPKDETVQVVRTTLTPGRYPYIQVQAGIPTVWSIDVPERSLNMCNFRMFIKEYGIMHTFSEGENTIHFIPEKPGMYIYTCWMGMIRGFIKVI